MENESAPSAAPTSDRTGADRSRDDLIAIDDRHVWHPFTPHSVYHDEAPLMVVAGEGTHATRDVEDLVAALDGMGLAPDGGAAGVRAAESR